MGPGGRVDRGIFRRVSRFSPEEFERRAGVISRMVARNRKAGGPPVVLLEIPSLDDVDPRFSGPGHAAQRRLYRAAVRRFAEREGLPYLDPAASAGIRGQDFSDSAHLGDDGARSRFSEKFLDQLLTVLRGVR